MKDQAENLPLPSQPLPRRPDLSLPRLGLTDPDADAETAGLIWMHALAIGYAPAYLTENADGIRQDWPRIPLPDTGEALEHSPAWAGKWPPCWTRKPRSPG